MKALMVTVACGSLAFTPLAFAKTAGKQDMRGQSGSGTAAAGVQVDQAKMKEMKMKTDQAMQKNKVWIDKNMQGWPEKTKEVAATTIAAHGLPQAVGSDLLVWGKSGHWKRTLLHRQEVQHDFPMPHKDVLQQFVDFAVPADKYDELVNYDGSVVAERTAGELSARCDKEEANFLAINLAADVAESRKTVDEARDYYSNAIKRMLAGKPDPQRRRKILWQKQYRLKLRISWHDSVSGVQEAPEVGHSRKHCGLRPADLPVHTASALSLMRPV